MPRRLALIIQILILASSAAMAQSFVHLDEKADKGAMPDFSVQKTLPVLAPEITLLQYEKHSAEQRLRLAAYQDETVITAELPDTRQKGEYQLLRTYTAQPRSLAFKSQKFDGDGFVKTNVIIRLLQSEVDHVERGDGEQTALNFDNYRFYYKGIDQLNGESVHVFHVKPRVKHPGLFKGKVFFEVHSGSLRQMEGTVMKSPSFFVKNLQFVQEFEDVDGFTVPTKLKSSAKARIIGRANVQIVHSDYHVQTAPAEQITASGQK